jgi:HD-GYP domain-containing protein (c-di-GMP phosphodiesterase class II)
VCRDLCDSAPDHLGGGQYSRGDMGLCRVYRTACTDFIPYRKSGKESFRQIEILEVLFIIAFNENKAVGRLSELIALDYGLDPVYAGQIRVAAALHDVGKLRVPREILEKPGQLTPHEFEIMKTHTTKGAEILSSIKGGLGEMARNCCRYHHENHSGTGYFGEYTDKLPVYIQFVGIADTFTALVSKRAYKEPWTVKEAASYIESKAHTQFAPELVSVFLRLIHNDSRVPEILGKSAGI